jgi:flagellar secretion chaperone FliS
MKYGVGSALSQYKQVGAHGGVADADPHRLIQMLMEAVLDRVNEAKGFMQRKQAADKGRCISKAISILDGLRDALDMTSGGEIARNLDNLYDYMQRRLVLGNSENKPENLDEVCSLMKEIKEAWDAIPIEVRKEHSAHKSVAQVAAP